MNFNEYSINVEHDTATVTGDAQKTEQVEMIWKAIGEMGKTVHTASIKQSEFQDWIRTSDEPTMQLFSVQQQNLNRILTNIAVEGHGDAISTESLEELGTYSMYQIGLLILFGVDGTVLGEGVQYLLDEQRKNPKLTLVPHCHDCGKLVTSHDEVLH